MKIQIENLKAQMRGVKLNIHQLADALIEFNKLIEHVETLESKVGNLGLFSVSGCFCDAPEHIKPCRHEFSGLCQYNSHCNFKTNNR